MDDWIIVLIVIAALLIILMFGFIIIKRYKISKEYFFIKKEIKRISLFEEYTSPGRLLYLRYYLIPYWNYYQNTEIYILSKEFSGIYVIFNEDKKLFYIGLSRTVFDRVCDHFKQKGNQYIFNDYENGDEFVIKLFNDINFFPKKSKIKMEELKTAFGKQYQLYLNE